MIRFCDVCSEVKDERQFSATSRATKNICDDCDIGADPGYYFGETLPIPMGRIRASRRPRQESTDKNIVSRLYVGTRKARGTNSRIIRTSGSTITYEQIASKFEKQQNRCFWTGIPLNLNSKTKRDLFAPSLDRLDANRGYHDNNVVIASWGANAARGIANADQFREWIAAVRNAS